MCQQACCRERNRAPVEPIVRWVCARCGNLLKTEKQVPGLEPKTLFSVGTCCSQDLPEESQAKCMPVGGEEIPRPYRYDQRRSPR